MLLYEIKLLVPNYSCLQNPWLRGYRPQIPVFSVLCPQLNLLNPPEQNSWLRHWQEMLPVDRSWSLNIWLWFIDPNNRMSKVGNFYSSSCAQWGWRLWQERRCSCTEHKRGSSQTAGDEYYMAYFASVIKACVWLIVQYNPMHGVVFNAFGTVEQS